ncbi:MAG TPA: DUF4440 domain-containing protein [Terracidiphilus sp.]|jgi:hypothetical protein|nr:DUF4440 domain-containing protein [Terracidiphilus sp.]
MSTIAKVDAATVAEVERLERLLLEPEVRRDRERVAALLTDDFFEFGKSGRVWTRERILEMLGSEDYTQPEVEDFTCHGIAADVVLVTYRTVRGNDGTGERDVTLRSSIWVKDAGRWKVRFHQGTREA